MELKVETTTNLDEIEKLIDKVGELDKIVGKLKGETVFVTPKDLAEMLGCSVIVAREIFNRADFPVCDYGKSQVVFLPALWDYFMKPVKRGQERR